MAKLVVQERTEANPKQLRRQGILPIGLIAKGSDTKKVQAWAGDVRDALMHPDDHGMIELLVEGEKKPRSVMVKHMELEPVTRNLVTVTFMEVAKDDILTIDVPVTALGTPPAIAEEGAVLLAPTDHIKIKGKAGILPNHIEVDISGLEVGSSIDAEHVKLPEGVELISSPAATIFALHPAKVQSLETETTDEGPTEPQLVSEAANDGSE